MNRRWFISSLVLLFVMSLITAQACGPDFYPDVFVRKLRPDNPKSFAAGKLGVLLPTYPRADLAVAFRYLNGGSLSTDEQKAYQPSYELSDPEGEKQWNMQQAESAKQVDPSAQWKTARAKYSSANPTVDKQVTTDTYYPDGTIAENYFGNCLDDAFVTAIATLQSRAKTWGGKSADLADWLKGQDIVFSNCSSKTHILPASAPPNASALLKADRAYQVAAAQFYSGNLVDALKSFDAIGQDSMSPWQGLARYLAARCLVRQAFNNQPSDDNGQMATFDPALMQQATMRLESMLDAPPQGVSRNAILNLRDLTRLRSNPMDQLHLMAVALAGPKPDSRYNSHLQDLTWYLNTKLDSLPVREDTGWFSLHVPNTDKEDGTDFPTPKQKAEIFSKTYRDLAQLRSSAPLVDWLITFQSPAKEAKDHAIAEWKKTHELYWFLAAITKATGKDAEAGDLVAAAEKINPESPAWESINYHRARLLIDTGRAQEARTLLDQIIPQVKSGGRSSSLSLYLGLRMRASISLNDALAYAPRKILVQASESKYALNECVDVMKNPRRVYDCKKVVDPLQFSEDATDLLNSQTSLAVLVQAARSDVLPEQLRRAIAMMAWVRSVLLKDDDAAAKLFPLLPEKLRQQAGPGTAFHPLMTLLRNPGLRPFLDSGVQRSYSYDFVESYRDNWWSPGWGGNGYKGDETPMAKESVSFLDATQQATVEREIIALQKQGSACIGLGERTLAYANNHPSDPDVPESLYLVLRMIRYSGEGYNWNDPPAVQELARSRVQSIKHDVVRLLRQRYAASRWTKKAAPFVG